MRRFLWCCLLFQLWLLTPLSAQPVCFPPSEEGVVLADSCCLYFPAGKSAFHAMFRSWDTLFQEGMGTVNILHIGGSHVQAGTFSHQVRARLIQTAPGLTGRRGFLFPFTVAKTNNPYNYKVTCSGKWDCAKNTQRNIPYPLGLSGMVVAAASPSASLSLCMRNNDGLFFDFDKIRVFGYSDSGRVYPVLTVADTVFQGEYDSVSRTYAFVLDRYTDSLTLSFVPKDSLWEPFLLRGILLDNDFPGFSYHAVGVNGASVPSYLQCPYFANDLQFLHPDLCVFGIGINDASGDSFDTLVFRQRYECLIEEIRRVAPECRFLFVTNNDSYRRLGRHRYAVNTNGQLARAVFYRLAAEYQGAVFDQFAIMGGLKSMKKWEEAGLAQRDKVHFTVKGYRYMGDLLYWALMRSYADYLKQKEADDGME